MEEIQFHPTGMVHPESKKGVLVTEAVRAEGGRLINSEGERFMSNYDDRMELASRDVVARAIYNEIQEGRGSEHGGVYLTVAHLDSDYIDEKLETMVIQFEDAGVDIKTEPMEVAPTAHHHMGGVRIDEDGRTTMEETVSAEMHWLTHRSLESALDLQRLLHVTFQTMNSIFQTLKKRKTASSP